MNGTRKKERKKERRLIGIVKEKNKQINKQTNKAKQIKKEKKEKKNSVISWDESITNWRGKKWKKQGRIVLSELDKKERKKERKKTNSYKLRWNCYE